MSVQKLGFRRSVIAGAVVILPLIAFLLSASLSASAESVFTAEEGAQALQIAKQYVNVEYSYDGNAREGVAYLNGGQDTVGQYLKRLEQGDVPGKEAGVDASGLIVNVFKSVYPGLKFVFQTADGKQALVEDVSSETLYLHNVRWVTPEDLKAGDLIFFGNSSGNVGGVGLYAGRNRDSVRIIVASYSKGKVVETGIRVNGDYWKTHIVGAGRLLKR